MRGEVVQHDGSVLRPGVPRLGFEFVALGEEMVDGVVAGVGIESRRDDAMLDFAGVAEADEVIDLRVLESPDGGLATTEVFVGEFDGAAGAGEGGGHGKRVIGDVAGQGEAFGAGEEGLGFKI